MLYHWFNDGELKASEGISITEGIGQGRITKNMELAPVDGVLLVKDFDVVEMVSLRGQRSSPRSRNSPPCQLLVFVRRILFTATLHHFAGRVHAL